MLVYTVCVLVDTICTSVLGPCSVWQQFHGWPQQHPPSPSRTPKNGTLETQSTALFSRQPRDRSSLSRSGLIIFNEFPTANDFTPCGNSEETKKVTQLHLFLSQPPARLFICCLQQPVPRLRNLEGPRSGGPKGRTGRLERGSQGMEEKTHISLAKREADAQVVHVTSNYLP